MKLVTPPTVQAVYEMLICLPHFNRWNLPPSKQVGFEVHKDPTCLGEYEPEPHVIRISEAKNGHLDTVVKTVAHEIIHMRLYLKGCKNWDKHDANFNELSHKIAITLGFDPKEL